MSDSPGLGRLRDIEVTLLRQEVQRLKEALAARGKALPATWDSLVGRLRADANLTREEAAMFLGVSTKKLQRMEAAGTLIRCPGMGSVVRYAARDVLRLASASSRKGA
jgi:hypothetical protein